MNDLKPVDPWTVSLAKAATLRMVIRKFTKAEIESKLASGFGILKLDAGKLIQGAKEEARRC